MITEQYVDHHGKCNPIPDGIADVDQYLRSPLKILWILKEPYDGCQGGVATGGGWKYSELLTRRYCDLSSDRNTWSPIAYVTYGLLHPGMSYEQMPDIKDDPSLMKCLKEAAYINVGKLPAFKRSNESSIAKHYQVYRSLLHLQIKTYNPDVVIGGNTLRHFKEDLSLVYLPALKTQNLEAAVQGHQVFIDAYHPANTKKGLTKSIYVNGILTAVRKALPLRNGQCQ